MYSENFLICIGKIFDVEGAFSNDPNDLGGPTNMGITSKVYKRHFPNKNIRQITKHEALEIYHVEYWLACRCWKFDKPVALMLLDCAVNQGPGVARKMLQKSAGAKPDGVIGPLTVHAVHSKGASEVTLDFAARRLLRYVLTRTFTVFGRGWFRRVLHIYALSTKAPFTSKK